MTLHQLLNEGTARLERGGDPEAGLDARRLLLEAFGLDTVHFLMNRMEQLEKTRAVEAAAADYRQMIEKRSRRIPLQHILGSQEFMGLTFKVNRHVLIPRQDTETLVETVLRRERDTGRRILDLCTGSGCIAVSLKAMGRYEDVTASDLSEEALEVARANGERILGEDGAVRFLRGDLFEALPVGETWDVIVSNPPYIPTGVIRGLEPEVRDHEPVMALDGDEDGLGFYRRIIGEAGRWLNPGGSIYLEIGHDQAKAVTALLRQEGFDDVAMIKDMPGKDRVVCGNAGDNIKIKK